MMHVAPPQLQHPTFTSLILIKGHHNCNTYHTLVNPYDAVELEVGLLQLLPVHGLTKVRGLGGGEEGRHGYWGVVDIGGRVHHQDFLGEEKGVSYDLSSSKIRGGVKGTQIAGKIILYRGDLVTLCTKSSLYSSGIAR